MSFCMQISRHILTLQGFSTTRTTELKSVGDAVQIVALIIGGAITLNVPNCMSSPCCTALMKCVYTSLSNRRSVARLLTATAANILCTVAAALMAYLPRSNTWGRLICFWLVNAQSVGFTVSLVSISSNMAGYTHRSLASAMIL